jgi:hypothetical protein
MPSPAPNPIRAASPASFSAVSETFRLGLPLAAAARAEGEEEHRRGEPQLIGSQRVASLRGVAEQGSRQRGPSENESSERAAESA